MTHSRALLDYLEGLPKRPWDGPVWRYTFGSVPPERENSRGARWNKRDERAIYTALDEDTAIAELRHALDMQHPRPTRGEYTLHTISIQAVDVVDLGSWDLLAPAGLSAEDVRGDSFNPCQSVGSAARWLSIGGLVVPSARSERGQNLVIFTEKQPHDFQFEVTDRVVLRVGEGRLAAG